MQHRLTRTIVLGTLAVVLAACSATQHRAEVQDDASDRVTVGTVQREITVGMSTAQVAEILGAPNIVSTDAERRAVRIGVGESELDNSPSSQSTGDPANDSSGDLLHALIIA